MSETENNNQVVKLSIDERLSLLAELLVEIILEEEAGV